MNQTPLSEKEVGCMVGLTSGTPMQAQTQSPFLHGCATENIVMMALL